MGRTFVVLFDGFPATGYHGLLLVLQRFERSLKVPLGHAAFVVPVEDNLQKPSRLSASRPLVVAKGAACNAVPKLTP
jgi:hypothetical protein